MRYLDTLENLSFTKSMVDISKNVEKQEVVNVMCRTLERSEMMALPPLASNLYY